jgi:hypothetical protein
MAVLIIKIAYFILLYVQKGGDLRKLPRTLEVRMYLGQPVCLFQVLNVG